MAWTSKQKQIAVRACKAARLSDEQRREVVLRHFANARLSDGRISSTSPRLTNQDFEQFMAVVEGHAGGNALHYTRGYWQHQAQDRYHRMRHRALAIAAELEACGFLCAGGVGLAGWTEKRVMHGHATRIEDLDYHQLLALNVGLQAYARQHGLSVACPAPGDVARAENQPDQLNPATDPFNRVDGCGVVATTKE